MSHFLLSSTIFLSSPIQIDDEPLRNASTRPQNLSISAHLAQIENRNKGRNREGKGRSKQHHVRCPYSLSLSTRPTNTARSPSTHRIIRFRFPWKQSQRSSF
ncbi:unnamed protein product [Vicia faba]|uniref:Uncharacterized protein n=1 Tax=Vicia faba TaxID=3906 RepID=A0AAV0YAR5_VICFA|nr:unnamed protein product [Vicia faba]CAI8604121.1 unnamed protein product [Vicia faba]